jgi:hypothetical protein
MCRQSDFINKGEWEDWVMGRMGLGYGSEFHLLRYLGRHRRYLNRAIEDKFGGRVLDWLDFSFGAGGGFPHWERS